MKNGFTLLEVLVAIFVLSVGVGGGVALVQNTTAESAVLSNQLIASYLAEEGLEAVRNIRDSNYLDIQRGNPNGIVWTANGIDEATCGPPTGCQVACIEDDPFDPIAYPDCDTSGDTGDLKLIASLNTFIRYSWGAYTASEPNPLAVFTPLKRKIIIEGPFAGPPEYIKVRAEVFWDQKGQTHTVTDETRLYNWLP